MRNQLLRAGIDQVVVKPWQWAIIQGQVDPVEIVSYPIPNEGKEDTIMVRLKVGDPISIKEVALADIAAIDASKHPWANRERICYDGTASFLFKDELPANNPLLQKGK